MRLLFSGNQRDHDVLLSECVAIPFENRVLAWDWAEKQKITIQYQGTQYNRDKLCVRACDLWYIPDKKARSWFILKWR